MSGGLATGPIFVDRDPVTGSVTATSFESMAAALERQYPIPDHLPAEIRGQLLVARSYFALAYEQANAGRMELYSYLTNDAFLKSILALELALRDRLGKPHAMLAKLIEEAEKQGILASHQALGPHGVTMSMVWSELKKMRNDITHANPDYPVTGTATPPFIGLLIDTILGLYRERIESSSAATS